MGRREFYMRQPNNHGGFIMRPNCDTKRSYPCAFFSSVLSDEQIEKMAIDSAFQKRKPKKLFPTQFLPRLLEESVKGSPSYNDLASSMDAHHGVSISKQGIFARVGPECVTFLELVLAKIISSKIPNNLAQTYTGRYTRILVQDSTVVRLPLRLFGSFSGVSNAHTSVCNARIQSVYDLIAGQFVSFSIDPYSKNDLAVASELTLRQGDLVLRDRGYLTSAEIARHISAQADCIYRHKHKTTYLDPQTGQPLDLLRLLQRDGHLDRMVWLNNDDHTRVRLVAVPVDEETANVRRMKAKREVKGHCLSQETLNLMSWTIFITTIPKHLASFTELLAIYGLRWRIENIFKTWKSNMSFAAIHNVSEDQLRTIILARLSMIVIIYHRLFIPLCHHIRDHFRRYLSIMKLLRYLQVNPARIYELSRTICLPHPSQSMVRSIARYCTYDNRKDRLNHAQIMENTLKLFALTAQV